LSSGWGPSLPLVISAHLCQQCCSSLQPDSEVLPGHLLVVTPLNSSLPTPSLHKVPARPLTLCCPQPLCLPIPSLCAGLHVACPHSCSPPSHLTPSIFQV
jgi:hypothetical protein